ncbi:hypothetical protein Anapl_12398 [Anas platyrhynchos]|uniref:Uncharacterized protein n=1 Tax=Anas platyrhynchos TaxID=8839 RepID=R0JZW0_ANAPL|nr:hypothetical protein Anapl_12398 [Anas platyrhynchos]
MLFGELVSACSCAGRSEKLTGFKKDRRKEKFPSSAATPKPLPAALEPKGFNTGFTDVHLVEYSEKDVSGLNYNYARAINLFEEIWICQQSFSLKARSEPAGITLVQRWGTLCPRAAEQTCCAAPKNRGQDIRVAWLLSGRRSRETQAQNPAFLQQTLAATKAMGRPDFGGIFPKFSQVLHPHSEHSLLDGERYLRNDNSHRGHALYMLGPFGNQGTFVSPRLCVPLPAVVSDFSRPSLAGITAVIVFAAFQGLLRLQILLSDFPDSLLLFLLHLYLCFQAVEAEQDAGDAGVLQALPQEMRANPTIQGTPPSLLPAVLLCTIFDAPPPVGSSSLLLCRKKDAIPCWAIKIEKLKGAKSTGTDHSTSRARLMQYRHMLAEISETLVKKWVRSSQSSHLLNNNRAKLLADALTSCCGPQKTIQPWDSFSCAAGVDFPFQSRWKRRAVLLNSRTAQPRSPGPLVGLGWVCCTELKTLNNRDMAHILQRHLPAEVSEGLFELFSSGPEANLLDLRQVALYLQGANATLNQWHSTSPDEPSTVYCQCAPLIQKYWRIFLKEKSGNYLSIRSTSVVSSAEVRGLSAEHNICVHCNSDSSCWKLLQVIYTTKITPGAQRSTVAVPKSLLLLPALQLTLVFTEMQGPHGESGTLHQGDAKGRLPWTSARQSDLDAEIARKLIYTQRCGAAPREIGLPPP